MTTEVNDTALTPLSFLERSAMVFPDRPADPLPGPDAQL